MNTQCTAPVEGHLVGSLEWQRCPQHGLGSQSDRPAATLPPPSQRVPERYEPAGLDDEVINGAVVREWVQEPGRYVVVYAESGNPTITPSYLRGRLVGVYDSEEEAVEWARKSFPLASQVAERFDRSSKFRRPPSGKYCSLCLGPMVQGNGDFLECRECPAVVWDYS